MKGPDSEPSTNLHSSLRFRLTVTDAKNVTATDEVTVTVKEDDNEPPKAVLGPDIILYSPNTAVDIDGSNSTDDNSKTAWINLLIDL